MKRKISLKWFLLLSFLALAALLIMGYSYLSVRFFFRGMDNVIADNMAHALESYVNSTTQTQRQQLNRFSGYHICSDWGQMPEEIRQSVDMPEKDGRLEVTKNRTSPAHPKKMFFTMQLHSSGERFFITHIATRQNASPLMGKNKGKNQRMLISISLLTALGLMLIIWILLRLVERPVKSLGRWAHDLTPETIKSPPPDFSYPELNELARLIQESLSSVQEALDREHRFLRYSSHELRTPISVVRTNVELLKKLRETYPETLSPKDRQQKKIIDRIERAGLTMKHLTETLLWLSRDVETDLPEERINLDELIRELVNETDYLLKDKEVKFILETSPAAITVPGAPARIVTGNLIRNAFQHTWCGTVRIRQTGPCVEMSNDTQEKRKDFQELGFGLGLQLTRQLCEKLNWHHTSQMKSGQHKAKIVFTAVKNSTEHE